MKNSIKQILLDLTDRIKEELPVDSTEKDRYNYDRVRFIGRHFNSEDRYSYHSDIETLRTLIYQIHFFGHIVITDEDGNNRIIKENKI
tara:strand:+ start:113 stop:376 length:264 start_codon:yes stop_codon:yes gene_type:complete